MFCLSCCSVLSAEPIQSDVVSPPTQPVGGHARTATHSALALAPKPAHRDSTGRDGTGSTQAGRTQTQAQSTHRETAVSSTAWLGWLLSPFLSVLLLIIPVSAGSVRSLHSVPSTCVLSSSSSLLPFSHKGPNLRTCDSRSALRSFPLFPIVPHLYSFPKAVPTPLSRPPSSRPPFLPASARSLVRNTGHRSLCSPHESSASLVSVSLFL